MATAENVIFKCNPDTKEYLLKQYDVDKPEKFDEIINILMDWINKQDHFANKNFQKEYLQKLFLCNKGSIERTKNRLEKLCTMRTLSPQLFRDYDFNKDYKEIDGYFVDSYMPTLTPDHNRVYILKMGSKNINEKFSYNYFKYFSLLAEYMIAHDYFNGIIVVVDYTDINMTNLVANLNPIDIQDTLMFLMQGYGVRIKSINLVSKSNLVQVIIGILKKCLSEKMASRLHVHSTVDTLKDVIPPQSLPKEYGGTEKPLRELQEMMIKEVSTDDHREYLKKQNEFHTDESLRHKDKYDQCLGLPGSFRTLSVD